MRPLFITTARKLLSRSQLCSEPLAGAVPAIDVATPGLPESRLGANDRDYMTVDVRG
jgi:hypothetical protein